MGYLGFSIYLSLSVPKLRYSTGAYSKLPFKTARAIPGAVVATLVLMLLVPTSAKPIVLVMGICAIGILVTGWLSDFVLSKDDGTPAMREVSDPIKVGEVKTN